MIAAAFPNVGMSPITASIKAIYGIANQFDAYLEKHIESLKSSDNPTIARTGRVIDAAKAGFGIGYLTAVAIMAAGQLLLGNPLSAIGTIAQAVTLTNPIAMTCGSVGAIYYGWGALTDIERNEILEKISSGLDVGIELIRSIIRFVIDKTKELLSSENLKEIKAFVSSAASLFGKTAGQITKRIGDVASDTLDVVRQKSGAAAAKAAELASDAYDTVRETAGKASTGVRSNFSKLHSPANNAWVGARYKKCGRVLVLLESTYGEAGARQSDDVIAWANGGPDRTFEALYRSCASDGESRLEFFDRLACFNLVPECIGVTNDRKVSDALLRAGATTLLERLRDLAPRVVWIASARVQPYALPIVQQFGARAVQSIHPSRAPHAALRAAFKACEFK